MIFKLGRNKSAPDIRQLKLSRYLIPGALPTPPVEMDYTAKVTQPWRMLDNDTLGCCVVAGAGHVEMTWTANGSGIWAPTDGDIVKAYQDVAGYVPGDPSTDSGTDPVTFLKYWRDTGLGLVSSPQAPHKIGAWAQADATKPVELQLGVHMFEIMFLGLALPNAITSALDDGNVIPWVIPDGQQDDPSWQPNPNSGHMVMSAKYDALGMYVVTWGQILLASWEFLSKCCDAPFVVLSKAIIGPNGVSPSGFDMQTLQTDLSRVVKA